MHKERILELADVIEAAPDEAFDMADFSTEWEPVSCGSPGCIAGFGVTHFKPEYSWQKWAEYNSNPWTAPHYPSPAKIMEEALELTQEQESQLFLKSAVGFSLGGTLKSTAVSVLRHLAETGEVDWDRFESAKADAE